MKRPSLAFVPYAVISIVHVVAIVAGAQALADIAATARMPLLALAVVLVMRGASRTLVGILLLAAITMSWLGGLSGSFAPDGLAWLVGILVVLWPHLGRLAIAVAIYGVVLAGTAIASTRGNALIAWGGALFLASGTFLSLVIFMPEAVSGWGFLLAMLTYNGGQGLLALGAVRAARTRSAVELDREELAATA